MLLISSSFLLILGLIMFCTSYYHLTAFSGWWKYGWLGLALFGAVASILGFSGLRYGDMRFLWDNGIENFGFSLSILLFGALLGSLPSVFITSKRAIKHYQEEFEEEDRNDLTARKNACLEEKTAELYGKLEKLQDIKLEIDRKEKDLEQRARVLEEKFKELDLEAESRRSADSDYKKQINSLQKALSSSRSRSKDLEHHRIYSNGFARYCEETLGMNTEEVNALKRKFKTEHQSKQQPGNNNPQSL